MMASSEQDTNCKPSRLRIIKNLVVISSSFILLFSGFDGLSVLQSTMNKEEGVGTICQALAYVMFCISSLLLPKYVIQKLGCKLSIILSQIFYIPWIASNFYPKWITLVPTSMLTGIAASTLWCGQCTYFNKASVLYCSQNKSQTNAKPKESLTESTKFNFSSKPLSKLNSLKLTALSISNLKNERNGVGGSSTKESSCFDNVGSSLSVPDDVRPASEDIVTPESLAKTVLNDNNNEKKEVCVSDHEKMNALFFGCHSLAYKTAEIWSNLMSYFILKIGSDAVVTDISSCSCGAYFCNADSACLTGNIGGISDDKRYLLSGICVALSTMAIVLLIFCLDSIDANREPVRMSLDILMATWNQCKKKEQIYLVPITFYLGLALGFYTADITKAYIGCAWGTYHIGLVTVSYGVSSAVTSSISGWLVRHIGRIPIISMGFAVTIATNIFLLMWTPSISQSYVFYLIASLWGVLIGTIWSQIPAFYGVLFKDDEEAAFACFYAWESLGWTAASVYSNYLCTYIKIYILMIVACAGIIGYFMSERSFALRKNENCQQPS